MKVFTLLENRKLLNNRAFHKSRRQQFDMCMLFPKQKKKTDPVNYFDRLYEFNVKSLKNGSSQIERRDLVSSIPGCKNFNHII